MHEPSRQETIVNVTAHLRRSDALYKVHFFGLFRVLRNDQPLGEPVWRRNKAKSLLKWFLLNINGRYSSDQLIKSFWPNATGAPAERNLYVAIHYLRHLLEPELPPRHESSYIRRNKDNFYWFKVDEDWWADIFDVHYHYKEAKEAEQRDELMKAITHYHQVVEYCRLGFLPEDAYEDIFAPYRRYYECLYTEVLDRLMLLCSQVDRIDDVLTYAHHALLIDPYSESAIRAIAQAYFRQGNTVGAIRELDRFRAFLREDLGVEPGEELLSLRKKIAELA